MTTIQTKVRNGLVTTALAGCVVLVSAPAYGAAPEPDQPVVSHQTKAQVEYKERGPVHSSTSGALSAQTKAQIERLERAAREGQAPASTNTPAGSTSDDDMSVPVTILALLAGGLLTGAAGTYTVSKMRQSGPAATRTA